MATRRLKRPRDPIQLGKLIVEAFADNQMLFLESLVRTRLPAGGGRIRTLGPALSAYRLGTASCRLRDPSPVPFRQNGIAFRDRGTEGSNPSPSSGESVANSISENARAGEG